MARFSALLLGAACIFLMAASASARSEWTTVGGGAENQRHSPLAQINTHNVGKLGGAWARELGTKTRSAPVVLNGVLYTVDATTIYALDAKTGVSAWEYTPPVSTPARGGVALGDGKVFAGLQDAHVIALDAKTGHLVWTGYIGNAPAQSYDKKNEISLNPEVSSFDPKIGTISAAPTYSAGKVILGLSGGDGGTPSSVTALDSVTGRQVWRWSVAPKPGEAGAETWPADGEALQLGGGAVWVHGAVDANLGLLYFGTGNAVPVLGGEIRPGNNLYMSCVVALDVNTGKLKWYYQLTRHDLWEMDVSTPLILYDTKIGGRTRKALAAMRTDGYLFVFDRATGEPLVPIEDRHVKQDIRIRTAATQPFPAGTDQIGPNCTPSEVMPSGYVPGCFFDPLFYDHPEVLVPFITVRQAPMSFDPQTGYFYVPTGVSPWWYRRSENPFLTLVSHPPGTKEYGILAAINSRTHKIAWQKRTPWVMSGGGGVMTTAGDLLFRMEGDGNFLALDARTGEQLWKFQTGYVSGPTVLSLTGGAPSAAYEIDGQEYIVVGIGKGLWAFKLNGNLPERPAQRTPPIEYGFQGIVQDLGADAQIGMSVLTRGVGPQTQEHYIDDTAFQPMRARLAVGTPVTFINNGAKSRTIVSADGSWTTGLVAPGATATVTISKPGRYVYFAQEFPWAKGQLIVQ